MPVESVLVVTTDGRVLSGLLAGVDPGANLVLDSCQEHSPTTAEARKKIELGLFLVRGDTVATVGTLIDGRLDAVQISHAVKAI